MLVDYARQHHRGPHVALLPDVPVTPPQIDPAVARDIAEAPGLKLLYVGNLEAYQGIDLMLDAFASVADDLPEATLLIVGGSAEHVAHYRNRAGRLAASGRLRLLGPRPLEHLPAILQAADVLLSPRIKGINTPMKIYNYMQAARPILATAMPTHTQVLDASTACLVDPTPAGFADGMRRLAADADLRRNLGEAAAALVQREYSPQRFRQRLAAFYDALKTEGNDQRQRTTPGAASTEGWQASHS